MKKSRVFLFLWGVLIYTISFYGCSINSGKVDLDLDGKPHQYLSEYNFFKGELKDFIPNDRVIPYDLNTPLFSDYAEKLRFVYVPEGKVANYNDTSVIDFPIGSCLIKTFYYSKDFRDKTKGRKIMETRVLVRRQNGWDALPYIWNEDQTDAILEIAGGTRKVSWISSNGEQINLDYSIPNKNLCNNCHVVGETFSPIGPKVRNLNKEYEYSTGQENQLEHWAKLGILDGLTCPATKPKNPKWNDASSGSLEERAKAYLDINCAHCHNPKGRGNTSGLDLRYENQDLVSYGLCKSPIAAGRGAGDMLYDIHPKHPERSILLYRMKSTDPGELMPEIGRQLVHKEGVELINEWISSMKESDCK
ncbi:MAG: hypothetical protein K1X82_06645 [Bacteroidia bacterium]|nr:hypothetical protein [Bacteroidia bacterium]